MAQAYLAEGMTGQATFSLFFRHLPGQRNYVLSCGIEDLADFAEQIRFSSEDLEYLRAQEIFSEDFLSYLKEFRFTGEIVGLPDGTPVFPREPLVEVTAPAPEAQILETWAMNQMHSQSVLATKAARIMAAARGRAVLDFGLRRMQGSEGGVKGARAFSIAGMTGSSNVLAGKTYGVPISGTMAHSYIQAHDSEMDAFRAFVAEFPETILLVDTYDTLTGVQRVVQLAKELGSEFKVRGIRIDSGDFAQLSRASRQILDDNGLGHLKIIASGGLDELKIEKLLTEGAPIDGFGVGSSLGVSEDAPVLDIAYKLVDYAGKGRMKLSEGKETLPGKKQIFRQREGELTTSDVLARRHEELSGQPLLEDFVKQGQRVRERESLSSARQRASKALGSLPPPWRGLRQVRSPFPVELGAELSEYLEQVRHDVRAAAAGKVVPT